MNNLVSFITLLIFLHGSTNCMIRADYQLYDGDMDHLVAGTPYNVLPVRSGLGGSLWSYEINSTCYVVQEPIDDLPSVTRVVFNHDKSQPGDWLTASTDLNVRFDTYCGSSSSGVFQVGNKDDATGQHFITTGGVEGNPGCGTINSWFQIEKILGEYSYKLVYCPSVCDLVNVTCSDVGVYEASGNSFPRWVLSDKPVLVRFQKNRPCRSNSV